MADMKATFGMDDAEFRRGVDQIVGHSGSAARRIEADWKRSGNEIRRMLLGSFAVQAVGRLSSSVRGLVSDYALLNDAVARANDEMASGVQNMLLPTMRGLGALVLSAGDGFVGMERKATGAIESIINGYSDLLRFQSTMNAGESFGNAKGVDEALAIMERQTRAAAGMKAVNQAALAFNASVAGMSGDQRAADEAAEQLRHLQERIALNQMVGKVGAEAVNTLIAQEDRLHALRMAHIREQAEARDSVAAYQMGDSAVDDFRRQEAAQKREQAEAEREKRELEAKERERRLEMQRRADANFSLDMDEQQRQAQILRLSGHDAEADALERKLQMMQKIREIETDESLSNAEKDDRIATLQRQWEEIQELVDSKSRSSFQSRSIGAGLGGDLSRQVFGGAGGGESPVGEQKKTNVLAKEIRDGVKQLIDKVGGINLRLT